LPEWCKLPPAWIEEIRQHGIDTQGIIIEEETLDLREFIAYPSLQNRVTDQPLAHFSRLGLPFPKSLHGYQDRSKALDSLSTPTNFTIKKTDIPESYWNAGAFHLAPIDYLTHSLIPAALRQKTSPSSLLILAGIHEGRISGNTFCTGEWAYAFFAFRRRAAFPIPHFAAVSLREMAEAIASFGCELIIIKRRPRRTAIIRQPQPQVSGNCPPTQTRLLTPAAPALLFAAVS
jgi:hypothetical protein